MTSCTLLGASGQEDLPSPWSPGDWEDGTRRERPSPSESYCQPNTVVSDPNRTNSTQLLHTATGYNISMISLVLSCRLGMVSVSSLLSSHVTSTVRPGWKSVKRYGDDCGSLDPGLPCPDFISQPWGIKSGQVLPDFFFLHGCELKYLGEEGLGRGCDRSVISSYLYLVWWLFWGSISIA